MKIVALFLFGLISVWLVHGHLLIRVSRLELSIKNGNKQLEELQKELEKKELQYDSLVDLERIGNEMRNKKKMTISDDIKFFKIEE
jgi:cell division protein FtsB